MNMKELNEKWMKRAEQIPDERFEEYLADVASFNVPLADGLRRERASAKLRAASARAVVEIDYAPEPPIVAPAKPDTPHKLDADLSGWELGRWPEELRDCFKVEFDGVDYTMTVSLDEEAFAAAAEKIAKEAIDAFFDSEFLEAIVEPGGVRLANEQGNHFVVKHCAVALRDRTKQDAVLEALGEEYADHFSEPEPDAA